MSDPFDDRLDRYLDKVRARMSWASSTWKDDQIAEIKTHVLDFYKAETAAGADSEEAMDKALASFGNPDQIGDQLHDQWKRDILKLTTLNTMRIGARGVSVLLTVLFIALAIGEGLPKLNQPFWVFAMLAMLVVMLAGMLLGWKYERAGGIVCLAGLVLFDATNYAVSGQLARPLMLVPFALVGTTYILCSVLDNNKKRSTA